MDILSLFDFQYLKERSQSWGTFWINNHIDALDQMTKRRLNHDMDYVDPNFIADMDETRIVQKICQPSNEVLN